MWGDWVYVISLINVFYCIWMVCYLCKEEKKNKLNKSVSYFFSM